VAVEDVVAQHQRHGVLADEPAADNERLRDAFGPGLHRIGQPDAPALAAAEQAFEARRVGRRGDEQDVADPG
jgi:hypothetical protein